METTVKLNIARDFSRYPAGRFRTDGPWSGQKFREDHLTPLLQDKQQVEIELDGTAGYGSSFLEEAFGGAVREAHLSLQQAEHLLVLKSSDDSLVEEIKGYIIAAAKQR
jgi:hypothetical protein